MRKTKFYRFVETVTILAMSILALTGCQQAQEGTASSDSISMADEIAQGVSEDAVPMEAKRYTTVSFTIPDGMVPDSSNTVNECYFISEKLDDLSYITYSRNDVFDADWYYNLTEDVYKESFSNNVDAQFNITSFVKSIREDYSRIVISMQYKREGIDFNVKEYIFVTENYLFTIVYAEDARNHWINQFNLSQASLTLESVISSISDNTASDLEVTNSTVGSEDILRTLSAGDDVLN